MNSGSFPSPHLPENRAVVLIFDGVISLIVFDALGEAKISDLYRSLIFHQHVAGGEVPVDVILRSQILHSLSSKRNKKNSKFPTNTNEINLMKQKGPKIRSFIGSHIFYVWSVIIYQNQTKAS